MPTHTPAALAVEDVPVRIPQGANWSLGWTYAEGDPVDVPEGWPDDWTGRMEIRLNRGGSLLLNLHSSLPADGLITLDSVTSGDDFDAAAAALAPGLDLQGLATIVASLGPDVALDATWTERTVAADVELTDGSRVIRLVEFDVILSGQVTTGD